MYYRIRFPTVNHMYFKAEVYVPIIGKNMVTGSTKGTFVYGDSDSASHLHRLNFALLSHSIF